MILAVLILMSWSNNSDKTTEGANTLPIAQVKGLKNTCHYYLVVAIRGVLPPYIKA